jgi:hypothetical protein
LSAFALKNRCKKQPLLFLEKRSAEYIKPALRGNIIFRLFWQACPAAGSGLIILIVNPAPPAAKVTRVLQKAALLFISLFVLASRTFGGSADYKLVLVETNSQAVRVRLPLTDVTGKVRVKEKSSGGFGLPVAPMNGRSATTFPAPTARPSFLK